MMCELSYCGMPKGTCQAKATSISEKIGPVALAIINLCLSEGISKSVSQLAENSTILFLFCNNLLEVF